MACTCVPCGECDGTGSVWWSFSGKYLGNSRLARMRAQEPEISMAAIENQRQQGRIRDGVKIADLTLEELQAVLADIYDQVNLRANMNA